MAQSEGTQQLSTEERRNLWIKVTKNEVTLESLEKAVGKIDTKIDSMHKSMDSSFKELPKIYVTRIEYKALNKNVEELNGIVKQAIATAVKWALGVGSVTSAVLYAVAKILGVDL